MKPRFFSALTLFVLSVLAPAEYPAWGAPQREPGAAAQSHIRAALLGMPLRFEANRGQTGAQVKYLARGTGYTLFLTPTEAVLALRQPSPLRSLPSDGDEGSPGEARPALSPRPLGGKDGVGDGEPEQTGATVLRMRLMGANPAPRLEGLEPLPGRVNYLLGNDPNKWHTHLPTYARVRYLEVYPGIDLIYYGNRHQLTYDLIIKPGADPSKISFSYEGVEGLRVTKEGDLELSLKQGRLIQKRPHIYQEIGGRRVEVAGKFTVQSSKATNHDPKWVCGFQVASYDKGHPLIIDPALVYSTYLGGTETALTGFPKDDGYGIAVDGSGAAYITGFTQSDDFPTASPLQGTRAGFSDVFVTKLDASGTSLVYSTYLGGSGFDEGHGIAVDSSGAAYITGMAASYDFPTVSPIQGQDCLSDDAFVTKLDTSGASLVYSSCLGGHYGREWGHRIAVDASGAAYITGITSSPDFPTVSPIQDRLGGYGYYDAFVAKVNASGTGLVYSTYLGGSRDDYGYGIAVDASGAAYIAGRTQSADFPTKSPIDGELGGAYDAFVTKIDASGTRLTYSTYLGGSDYDYGYGIAVDASGAVYVTGATWSTDFPTAAPIQGAARGLGDAFVTKIDAAGTGLVYSTYLGGSGSDGGNDIAVDSAGATYLTGGTSSTDFPIASPIQGTSGGYVDVFVTKIGPAGAGLVYSTYLGGNNSDSGKGIAVDGSGAAYITGQTTSADFPTVSPIQGTIKGYYDAFVAKIGEAGTPNLTAACTPCAEKTGEPIQTGTGEYFTQPRVDLDLGGPLPLVFIRSYAARLKAEGAVTSSLGPNWTHNFDLRLKDVTGASLDVVYSGGKIISFRRSGSNWTLKNSEEVIYQLRQDASGDFWLMDPARRWISHFSAEGRLLEIKDRSDNTLTLTYDAAGSLRQVVDGLGRQFSFTYDASDHLTQLTDGTRTLTYSYTDGVLTGFADALGNTTTYVYDTTQPDLGPLLTATERPLGNRPHTQTYDAKGRVTQQVDALGNITTFEYDMPAPGTTTLTDPLGNRRETDHARQKVMTQSTDARSNTSSFAYNDHDRRTSSTDRMGNTTTMSYQPESGLPAFMTDARSNTGSFTYTSQEQTFGTVTFTFQNLTRIDYPDGTHEEFTYDARGNLLTRADRAGNVWTYTYNARGQLLTGANPEGGVSTHTYHADGTLASTQNSDTGPITFEYDGLKRLTKIIHPDGTSIRTERDLNNRITAQTDENGQTTLYTYDANGNLIAMTDALGQTIQYTYDSMDRLITSADRLGKVSSTTYDALGRPASWTDPQGNITQYTHNENGWLVQVTDAAGKAWKTDYDNEGRRISNTSPLGNSSRYEWDGVGNLTRITDPLDHSATFLYDSLSRMTSATDPLGRTVQYSYDPLGFLASITPYGLGTATYTRNALGYLADLTDLREKTWSFTTTSMGRLSSTQDPLKRGTRYSYDSRARLSQVTYPTGETQAFTYDGVGNILRIQHTDGTELAYTYDVLNRLISANGMTLSYDAEGNITSTQDGGVSFGASYDDAYRPKSVTYNHGAFAVTYTYDQRHHLAGVTDSLTGTTLSLTYDEDGRLTSLARSNGITTTYTWDAAYRLTRIQDSTIADQHYAYNEAGEVTPVTQTLPLDPASLLTSRSDSFTYDDASQVSSSGYAYDARGRQTASPAHALVWDGAGRLRGTGTATLEYNGLSDLRRRKEGSTALHYHYHHTIALNPIVAEQDEGTGQFLRYYIWTPNGNLLYMIDATAGNRVYFYHFDPMGSTLFLTDASGAVTDTYAYDPYGLLLGHNGSNPQPFTFIGRHGIRQESPRGLYQMRARYYDAVTARFLSPDPAWPRVTTWAGLNPYLYARGNPLKYLDPTGRVPSVLINWFIRTIVRTSVNAARRLAVRAATKGIEIAAQEAVGAAVTHITMDAVQAELNRAKDRVFDVAVDVIGQFEADHDQDWTDWFTDLLNPLSMLGSASDISELLAIRSILAIVEGAGPTSDPGPIMHEIESAVGSVEHLALGTGFHGMTGTRYSGRVGHAALQMFLAQWAAQHATQLETIFCLLQQYGVNSVDELLFLIRTGRFHHIDFGEQIRYGSPWAQTAGRIQGLISSLGQGGSVAAIVMLFNERLQQRNRPPTGEVPY